MPDQYKDGLRALTYRDFGTKLKYLELRAAAIVAAMTEPSAPKVRDIGTGQFQLTTKKGSYSVLVSYAEEDGLPVIRFIYDYKAQGVFSKITRCLGSQLQDLAEATPSEVLEFAQATSQDCA